MTTKRKGHRPKRRDAKPGIPCGLSIDTGGHKPCESAVKQIAGVWACQHHVDLAMEIKSTARMP